MAAGDGCACAAPGNNACAIGRSDIRAKMARVIARRFYMRWRRRRQEKLSRALFVLWFALGPGGVLHREYAGHRGALAERRVDGHRLSLIHISEPTRRTPI